MPAPSSLTWYSAMTVPVHTGALAVIDGGTGAGKIQIRNSADALLAEIALTDPAGTVNGTTGQITLTPDGREESAPLAGTASYAEIRDGDDVLLCAMPCEAGTSAVANKCVLSTLTIALADPVEIISATIG